MSVALNCPCGVWIKAEDDEDLVRKANEHLRAEHPGMEYSDEQILALAVRSLE